MAQYAPFAGESGRGPKTEWFSNHSSASYGRIRPLRSVNSTSTSKRREDFHEKVGKSPKPRRGVVLRAIREIEAGAFANVRG